MHKNERRQDDEKGDSYSDATGVSFTNEKDMARQEDAKNADINVLMHRFGVQPMRQGFSGDVDYTMDLQTAIEAKRQMQRAWGHLPGELRNKYRNWDNLFAAIDKGEITKEDISPTPKPEKDNATRDASTKSP